MFRSNFQNEPFTGSNHGSPEALVLESKFEHLCMENVLTDGGPILADILVVARKSSTTTLDLCGAGFRAATVDVRAFSLISLDEQLPILIVLDRGLPSEDIIEVCRLLKIYATRRHIPVLVLLQAIRNYPSLPESAYKPDHYLVESFTLARLIAVINSLLLLNNNPTSLS